MHSARGEVFLETPRMFFRKFDRRDAQLLFELDNDPEVMRFISKGAPTPLERIENVVLPRFLDFYAESPPRGFWAAHLRETSEFIGWFHLRPDKFAPDEMELGYRLKRSVWGRGLATEGSRALIESAFLRWNYAKVSARTLLLNLPSRRVMEKAGLLFESEFLWPGAMMPEWTEEERRGVKYSLTHSQFHSHIH